MERISSEGCDIDFLGLVSDLEWEHLQINGLPSTLKGLCSENIFSYFHLDFFCL